MRPNLSPLACPYCTVPCPYGTVYFRYQKNNVYCHDPCYGVKSKGKFIETCNDSTIVRPNLSPFLYRVRTVPYCVRTVPHRVRTVPHRVRTVSVPFSVFFTVPFFTTIATVTVPFFSLTVGSTKRTEPLIVTVRFLAFDREPYCTAKNGKKTENGTDTVRYGIDTVTKSDALLYYRYIFR